MQLLLFWVSWLYFLPGRSCRYRKKVATESRAVNDPSIFKIGVLMQRLRHTVLNVEVLVGAFNQEKEACRGLLCNSENRSWNRWIVCSSRKWPLSTTAILSGPRMQLCIHGSWWEDFYKEVKRSKMSLFDICCWLLLPPRVSPLHSAVD